MDATPLLHVTPRHFWQAVTSHRPPPNSGDPRYYVSQKTSSHLPPPRTIMATTTAESLLKTGHISSMIKQGFISSPPSLSPPSPTTPTSHPPPNNTLFHMITQESSPHSNPRPHPPQPIPKPKWVRIQTRIQDMVLGQKPIWGPCDVELVISSNDGVRVSMEVHRRVLAMRSSFFKENLGRKGGVVEIFECDDVEVYVEVVGMMYCEDGDLRRMLGGEEISKVLGLLKVSAAIRFDAGVTACLEYLEAVPWSEDQEKEIISVLSHLNLQKPMTEVLQRVSVDTSTTSRADDILLQLLSGVLQAKDEKARREMKALIPRLLGEDANQTNVSKETLYRLCHESVDSLLFSVAEADTTGEIARQADNLHWLVEILINKKLADEFITVWADQHEIARLHPNIPCMYRFDISRITALLCIAIGKREIMVSKDARFSLLQTWLDALYDDFGWIRRVCRTLDKKAVEDGLCKTILTLSMAQQEIVLMRWFDRFLKKGDDCPNLQRAFEVWWRRTFVRRYEGDCDKSSLHIALCDNTI